MTTTDLETAGRSGGVLDPAYYNKIGGASFAIWGVIHVVVGAIGLAVFTTGGTGPMLEFVNLDPAVNEQASRMGALVAEFYQALLLVGLTTLVLGVTLNWRGEPLGLGLNTILVASIEAFFVWFEVLPGHRPASIAVLTVALLVIGVVFSGLGSLRQGSGQRNASSIHN